MNISMNERAVGKLREELSVKSAKVNDLTEEVEVLKNTLAKTHVLDAGFIPLKTSLEDAITSMVALGIKPKMKK